MNTPQNFTKYSWNNVNDISHCSTVLFSSRRTLNSMKLKQLRGMAAFSSLRFQYITDTMDINLRHLILNLFTTKKKNRQLHLNTWISTKGIKFISSYHLCRSPISSSIRDCLQNETISHPVLEAELVCGYQNVLFCKNVPSWAAKSFLRWVSCMKNGLYRPLQGLGAVPVPGICQCQCGCQN